MAQLQTLKAVLGNPDVEDAVLQFYLNNASDIICDIRHSERVESRYLTAQIKIAVELFNKVGAEGQVGHSENGVSRSYENAEVSASLLRLITPVAITPYSVKKVVT